MQHKLLQHQRALFLRKKKGYTYREIQEEIPVAKSTLSKWLSGIDLTEAQRERIRQKQYEWTKGYDLGEWNRKKRQQEVANIRLLAEQAVQPLTAREFFIAGVLLYWAEGSKRNGDVRFINSDPILIKFMVKWFKECASVSSEELWASLHYHEGQSEYAIRQYWSNLTGIPMNQFYKSFCKPPGTGHRKNILQWGTLQLRVKKCSDLYHRIFAWRDGLIEQFISGKNLK